MTTNSKGKLIVVSGPSGVGKSTLLKRLFPLFPDRLEGAVSATTRPPRPGEVHGKDYFFMDQGEFDRRREAGEFLECFEVFGRGYWYGTLLSQVTPRLEAGKWVLLEIDVQGAHKVFERFPEAVSIFIRPESLEVVEARLRSRGTESEEVIQRRLAVARHELAHADRYRYQVINDDLERALREVVDILNSCGG